MKVKAKPGLDVQHMLPGSAYLVFGINRWMGKEPFVMLLDDDGLPFGVPVSNVITIDDRIPSSWTVRIEDDGNLSIQPAAWQDRYFWNVFWDVSAEGVDHLPKDLRPTFEAEVARIREEVG